MTLEFIWLHYFSALSKDTAACFTWLLAPGWNRVPRKINSIHFSGRLIVFYAWPHDLWPSLLSGLSEQAGRGVWLCWPEVRRYVPGCERVLGFVMKLWGWNHSLLCGVVAHHVLSQGCHIYSVIRDQKLVYLSCDPGRLIDTSGVARVSALLQFSQGLDSRYRCHSLYVSVFLTLARFHVSSDRLILCHSDITIWQRTNYEINKSLYRPQKMTWWWLALFCVTQEKCFWGEFFKIS